jgi:hypothetical protein
MVIELFKGGLAKDSAVLSLAWCPLLAFNSFRLFLMNSSLAYSERKSFKHTLNKNHHHIMGIPLSSMISKTIPSHHRQVLE